MGKDKISDIYIYILQKHIKHSCKSHLKALKEITYTCKWLFTLNMVNKFESISFSIAFGVASVIMMSEIVWFLVFVFSKAAKLISNYLLSAPPRLLTHLTNCSWRSWVHLIRFLFVGVGLDDDPWQTCLEMRKAKFPKDRKTKHLIIAYILRLI